MCNKSDVSELVGSKNEASYNNDFLRSSETWNESASAVSEADQNEARNEDNIVSQPAKVQ